MKKLLCMAILSAAVLAAQTTYTAGANLSAGQLWMLTSAGQAIPLTANGTYTGIAQSAVSSGGTVTLANSGTLNCLFENTAVSGDLVIQGTTTPSDCRDAGTTSPAAVPATARIYGTAAASGSGVVAVNLHGPALIIYGTYTAASGSGGGANIAHVSNLIAGDGAGNGVDSGIGAASGAISPASNGGVTAAITTGTGAADALMAGYRAKNVITGDSIFFDQFHDQNSLSGLTTTYGYASFDSNATVNAGTTPGNHIQPFQNRTVYNGTGTLGSYTSFISLPVLNGPVTTVIDFLASEWTGTGTVTNHVGFSCGNTPFAKAATNFCFYQGGNIPNYFGGPTQFDSRITANGGVLFAFGSAASPAFTYQTYGGGMYYDPSTQTQRFSMFGGDSMNGAGYRFFTAQHLVGDGPSPNLTAVAGTASIGTGSTDLAGTINSTTTGTLTVTLTWAYTFAYAHRAVCNFKNETTTTNTFGTTQATPPTTTTLTATGTTASGDVISYSCSGY